MRKMKSPHGSAAGQNSGASQNEKGTANLFVRILPLLPEIARQAGYQGPLQLPVIESAPEPPPWVICVCGKLAKTVFKTTGAFRVGEAVDYYQIGKVIGLLLRLGQFYLQTVPQEIDDLKLDQLPKEKLARVTGALDLTPIRPHLIAAAKEAPDTGKPSEELLEKSLELMVGSLAHHVGALLMSVLAQPPSKVLAFLRGLPEGYTMFLLENGEFAGDRGRTADYLTLIAFWPEIEELRAGDGISRKQLYETLCTMSDGLLKNEPDRFETVCEEVGLALKKPGPPRKK